MDEKADLPQEDGREFTYAEGNHRGSVIAQDHYIKPQARKLYDPDVTFEEYYYYAQQTREEQKGLPKGTTSWQELILRKKPAHNAGDSNDGSPDAPKEHTEVNFANSSKRMDISDQVYETRSAS